ncbi:MAG: ABC transporter ATP-binding protein [Oscillospiraceae bacterium]|jgi:ABC-2 type transport system ATP-binding protein|nr:ABC transporter ATP-binding protein [Lachnospiraceae bacterium]MCI9456992.1 ABC transporter ATP-binding protein [Oscillospiraceae bacterium]
MELTINNLSKEYGKKKAVRCFNATLTNGVYGLLGANGAGKTTLMRMICDVQTETKGAIMFNGQNIHDLGEQYRNILGYLPQHFGYYPNFTAYKFLMYIAAIKGLPHKKAHNRSLELLEKVGLTEQKNAKIKTFSGGMKQRLGIAQALLNNPKILILDEPTAGLDPKERVRFRNLISTLAENRIVILSTHIVSDVEYIAKEILIMKNGELLRQGSPETILKSIHSFVWECDVPRQEIELLEKNYIVANLKHSAEAERLRIISEVSPYTTAWNVEPTLEDLYLYYFAEVSDNE